MAPVITALCRHHDAIDCRIVLTGQHTTLVDRFLELFELDPHYDLGIMTEGQSLYDLAHGCLDGLRNVLEEFRPDLVLVQGDTASVFFASLAAFFERVRVGHVEAGLRSGKKWAPFPEEMFRRLTDGLSDFYFAPTPDARENLLGEGVPIEKVFVTGNTVVDALLDMGDRIGTPENPVVGEALGSGDRIVLVTAHRRESFGEPLREVCAAIREIADRMDAPSGEEGAQGERAVRFLYPVHPNPEVRKPAHELLGGHPRIHLTEPLDYLDLVALLRKAALVLTDSGGIQEEAPTFGAPVLVLRDVTERPEGIASGAAVLVGTDRERIVRESLRILSSSRGVVNGAPGSAGEGGKVAAAPAAGSMNPYGDGRAGERIADIVVSSLCGTARRTEEWRGA